MNNKRKGVSLITLIITVIVIIILAGAVILNMMQTNPANKSKEAVFKMDVASYKEELELYHLDQTGKKSGDYERTTLNKIGQAQKEVITVMKATHIPKFKIQDGILVYIGTDGAEKEWTKDPEVPEIPEISEDGSNKPVLAPGMTPVKWNETEVINTTESDSEWYNYDNKQWANARTADGSFWVWIPRYEYKIPNPHTKTPQSILINFKQGTSTSVTNGYILHPAFTFGTTQLKGIWVAKFEATTREGVDGSYSNNVTAKNVKIIPGEETWKRISVSNTFDVARKMETDATYGWGTSGSGIDTHMMKNIEWGAMLYLAHSIYGRATSTSPDNASYLTGGGIGDYYISDTTGSITGNVYGVYNMLRGSGDEAVAAYVDTGSKVLTDYGASLVGSESKYKDVYVKGANDDRETNYEANSQKVGDAIYETSILGDGMEAWYSDWSIMPCTNHKNGERPFFVRGSNWNAGGDNIFCFYPSLGDVYSGHAFRVTLCVSSGI